MQLKFKTTDVVYFKITAMKIRAFWGHTAHKDLNSLRPILPSRGCQNNSNKRTVLFHWDISYWGCTSRDRISWISSVQRVTYDYWSLPQHLIFIKLTQRFLQCVTTMSPKTGIYFHKTLKVYLECSELAYSSGSLCSPSPCPP